ncbi:MAG: hypothetical protein EOP22_08035 [Hyphomicrobiales bacterium]|nr:MAG: hypothetical protein EOP22_08035 [Hyphomicrobiales bacterium]
MDEPDQLEFYRTLLLELRQANADMERGIFRLLRQDAAGGGTEDVTAEAIRTNQISVVLLEGTIRMLSGGRAVQ